MKKLLLFSGTTEGTALIHALSKDYELTVSVATPYGAKLIENEPVQILCGRLDEEAMVSLLGEKNYNAVIDATHPYAEMASKTIRAACSRTNVRYLRCKRASSDLSNCRVFYDLPSLCQELQKTKGAVLLTTGSKEMQVFTKLPDFSNRCYLRILPDPDTIRDALNLGFAASHLIAMQGPFSMSLNRALCEQYDIRIVVTKDGGAPASFAEKKEAALLAGAEVWVLSRPLEEEGISLQDLIAQLKMEAKA